MRRRTFLAQCAILAAPRFAIAQRHSTLCGAEASNRAVSFLIDRQHADGSWKSDAYGVFKDGRALTPLVSLALRRAGTDPAHAAAAKAMSWVEPRATSAGTLFPVHNASWLLQAIAGSEEHPALRGAMTRRLHQLQLNTSTGWDRAHPYFGGWSYAPRAPIATGETAPFQQPNLSATVLAVAGLSAAGVGVERPVIRDALQFLQRCQNIHAGHGEPDAKFDDGGFFQLHDDPSRNKAGAAGTDSGGNARQRSYTSATADGLRGLVMCGIGVDDPKAVAAVHWLDKQLDLDDVPDLRHYAAYSTTLAGDLIPDHGWHDMVAKKLTETQRPDGSWHNPAGEMREDDPLVATSLAVLALRRSP